MTKIRYIRSLLVSALLLAAVGLCSGALSQNNPATANAGGTTVLQALPPLIRFSGEFGPQVTAMMQAAPGESAGQPKVVTITFSLFESQQSGAPLWTETQDVEVDEHGRYTVFLGAASPDGLPLDLFANAQARWLSAQPHLPGFGEQSRIALMGVPYAVKAADADSLGGKPASAYLTTNINPGASTAAGQGAASANSVTQTSRSLTLGATGAAQSLVPAPLAIAGSGTADRLAMWTGSSTLGNSEFSQSGNTLVVGSLSASNVGTAVSAKSSNGDGVKATSGTGDGVAGTTSNPKFAGVLGNAPAGGNGVVGETNGAQLPKATGGNGVEGLVSGPGEGVLGSATGGGYGVYGESDTIGVLGNATGSGQGVKGQSETKGGVVGESTSGDGVAGVSCSSGCPGAAIVGVGHLAGAFSGNVGVTGNLVATGVKSFHIDHPLDPANKYLNHFAMESNEVLNTYSGNVTTDLSGAATVTLPAYFSALNVNYRYQLTVIGQFAQAIVFKEIVNNSFVIKTDKPSVKVSWQVTGVRHDAWVRNHPPMAEEAKPQQERGYYLQPEFFGQSQEKSIFWLHHGYLMRDAKAPGPQEARIFR
jgi:hypothetical protein